MTRRRIHNKKTGKYYELRQRTTGAGKKGQIKGSYKQKAAKKVSDTFSSALKRLADT